MKPVFIDFDSAQEPSTTECREAIYSQGGACKKCQHKCYRQGMSKADATADNRRLVREKLTV